MIVHKSAANAPSAQARLRASTGLRTCRATPHPTKALGAALAGFSGWRVAPPRISGKFIGDGSWESSEQTAGAQQPLERVGRRLDVGGVARTN